MKWSEMERLGNIPKAKLFQEPICLRDFLARFLNLKIFYSFPF